YIVERIRSSLPPHVELFQVKLSETATSAAEWCSEDEKK
ncbi:MAG: 6-carboxytetrahydropterin synthase QueD, partial [Bacteroidetes bacterium]|nr:6-carboxytetrahydropterin synthase QueD [Bacteroidota bacterium]